MSLLAELQRRNVIRMAGLYLVGAWLLVQVASTLLPVFEAPPWVMKTLVALLAIGIVPALVFSWLFELTPDGLKRDGDVPPGQSIAPRTAQRMNRLLVAGLMLALVYFALDKFVLAPGRGEIRGSEPLSESPAMQGSAASPSERGSDPLISIAVLPFVDMSQAKDQEYFSDGLSEELLNQLAQVQQLRVIARTSSFSFKGTNTDVATIAKTLNVAHVLEGSVRKSGNTLRITAQLIRAADSSHLWSQTYDRELADVFKVQDEISTEVVSALKVKLLPAQQLPKAQGTSNTDAYEHYLRGLDIMRPTRLEVYGQAAEEFRKAIALDPGYVNAYVMLSFAQLGNSDLLPTLALRDAEIQASFDSAEKALELAPDLGLAYTMRGYIRFTRYWDWAGAKDDFERAQALDPNDARLPSVHADYLMLSGHPVEAVALARKSTEINPLSINAWHRLGLMQFAAGQEEAARASWQHGLGINASARWPNFLLGLLELRDGELDAAAAHFNAADEPFRWTGIAMLEFTLGKRQDSDRTLASLKSKYAAGSAFQIAAVHAWRGEKDLAFEWLDRAYAQKDAGMPRLAYDPSVDKLRGDPRFVAMLKKMAFPE